MRCFELDCCLPAILCLFAVVRVFSRTGKLITQRRIRSPVNINQLILYLYFYFDLNTQIIINKLILKIAQVYSFVVAK